MQVTETTVEGLKREYKVVVAAADIETKITERLKEVAKTVNLPGFRPGKAPVKLLRQRYGKAVLGEVLEKAVDDSTRQIMEDNELKPAVQPSIEVTKFDEGTDLEYDLKIEVFPEFTTMDLSSLELERLKVEAADTDIDEALERLAANFKDSEPVTSKRKSKSGDILVIDFLGRVDGEEFAGGKAEDYQIELGSNTFIPGFEDQLVGAKAGDALTVKVAFPENYQAENLAGKDAEFDVTVKELREGKPAVIDDELAKKVGLEDLAKLREQIAADHTKHYDDISRMRVKKELFDKLVEAHAFELPETMVKQEFDLIWKQFEDARQADPDAIDDDDKNKSDEELQEDYGKLAERRVRLALLLSDVGRANSIEVSQDELNRQMMVEARKYQGQEAAVFEYFKKNPQAVESLRGPIFEDKVVDFILEMAQVSDKAVTADALMEEDEPEAPKKKPAAKKKAAPKKKPAAKKADTAADDTADAPAKKAPARKKPAAKKPAAPEAE